MIVCHMLYLGSAKHTCMAAGTNSIPNLVDSIDVGSDVDNMFVFPVEYLNIPVFCTTNASHSKIPSAPMFLRWDSMIAFANNAATWAGFQVKTAVCSLQPGAKPQLAMEVIGSKHVKPIVLALKSMATFTDRNGFEPRVQWEKWFAYLKLYKHAVASRRSHGPRIGMKCCQAWLSNVWCHRNLDLVAACFVCTLLLEIGLAWTRQNVSNGQLLVGATTLWVHVGARYEWLTHPDTEIETLAYICNLSHHAWIGMSLSLRSSLSFAYFCLILNCVAKAFN